MLPPGQIDMKYGANHPHWKLSTLTLSACKEIII
jgi:hypothetical protein